jgi:hypothetical protein
MEKVNITRRVFLLAEPNSELLVTPFQYLIIKGRCTLLATQSGKKKVKLTRKTALTAYPGSTAFISDKQYKHVKGSCEIAPSTFTVTYKYQNAPAGAPALPATASYEAGTRVYVAERPESPIGDYEFLYWMKDGSMVSSYFTMPEKNVTITGWWGEITKYDVMYSWTGDGVPADCPEPPATVSYVPGEAVQVEPEPTSYNTEFRFLGWSSDDIDISSGSFYMPNHPVGIRGTWYFEKVKISFGVVDEQGPEDFYMDPVYAPYWQPYNLPVPEQTWPGWNFAYWVSEDDPKAALEPGGQGDPISVANTDIKLLAVFKKAE